MAQIVIHVPRLKAVPYGEQIYYRNFLRALTQEAGSLSPITINSIGLRGRAEHMQQMSTLKLSGATKSKFTSVPESLLKFVVRNFDLPLSTALFGNADVVHSMAAHWIPSDVKNLLVTIQDVSILRSVAGNDNPKLYTHVLDTLSYLTRIAKKIITISEFQRNEINELLPVQPEQIVVIPNGVDSVLFHPPTDIEKEQSKRLLTRLGITRPYLLHMGGSTKRKNVARLIASFYLAKEHYKLEHQLVLSGSAHPPKDVLDALSKSIHKADVIFSPYLEQSDLVSLLQAADMLVFPSLYEGFGMPPLEAMACGVPTALSNAASLPEVGGDAAVYFDPTDIEDMARAINSLSTNTVLKETCIKQGLVRAVDMSWEKNARTTIDLYQLILAERS